MINAVRHELLLVLTELSAACSEMRFGQLIANVSTLAKGPSAEGLWEAEDDELLAAAQRQLTYFRQTRPAGVEQAAQADWPAERVLSHHEVKPA